MQVSELSKNGLELKLKVVIPGAKLAEDVENTIKEMAKTYKMPGFRDGNVPLSFIKKKEGTTVMTKVIEDEIESSLQKIFKEKEVRVASQPSVEVLSFDEENGLIFTADIEQFPNLPVLDWGTIGLETVRIRVSNQDFNKAYEDILTNLKDFEPAAAGSPADIGDAVIIDFKGFINQAAFEGGSGNGVRLELGSNQFIAGFESQLVGAKVGDEKKVEVIFPKNYHKKELSNKPAIFEVKIKEVLTAKHFEQINDEVAQKLGLENLEKLNEAIKQKLDIDFQGLCRLRTKKLLFDKIDKDNRFDIPPSMLKADFDALWNDVKHQKETTPEQFKDKTDEQLESEYKGISERRVRLGLILAETAKHEKIEVSNDELQYAITIQAMQNPGGSEWIREHYKNPDNIERLRGPLLEEKVVDFIISKIKTDEIEISSKEFFEKYANDIKSI
jgi:trigger factor